MTAGRRLWQMLRSAAGAMRGRRRVAAASGGERVVVRQLQGHDLERAFDAAERVLGEEWLARQATGAIYVAVAELEGVIVGRRGVDFAALPDPRTAHLFGATVQRPWRSQGIGALLDQHLEDVARQRGCDTLHCAVAKTNGRALIWHERLGYRRAGEMVTRWKDSAGAEVAEDCWLMERPVVPRDRSP